MRNEGIWITSRLSKKGAKTWVVSGFVAGKQRYFGTFHNETEATDAKRFVITEFGIPLNRNTRAKSVDYKARVAQIKRELV